MCAIEQRGRGPCIGDDAINFARKKYILQFETNTLCNLKQIHLMKGEERRVCVIEQRGGRPCKEFIPFSTHQNVQQKRERRTCCNYMLTFSVFTK